MKSTVTKHAFGMLQDLPVGPTLYPVDQMFWLQEPQLQIALSTQWVPYLYHI
jgi:hypothetical protein